MSGEKRTIECQEADSMAKKATESIIAIARKYGIIVNASKNKRFHDLSLVEIRAHYNIHEPKPKTEDTMHVLKGVIKKVKLLKSPDFDKIDIARDHNFRNVYIIDLPLDSAPDEVWLDLFEREWKSACHLWDRKLFVMHNKLRLMTTIEDIEGKLDWLIQVIERTNEDIDKYNEELVARDTELQNRSLLEAEEKLAIDHIRDALRKRLGTV